MKKIFLSALKTIAPVLLFSTAMQASAAPITYFHSGYGAGTLNGVAFEADFLINAIGDTDNIAATCGDGCLQNINLAATISISGIGTLTFITPTSYLSDESGVAFARTDGTSLFESSTNAPWDMKSTVELIEGDGQLLQWSLQDADPIITTGGALVFFDAQTLTGFAAITADVCEVPLPAGAWLFGSGLIGLVGVARRKA